jgi:hypothetical protein
MSIVIRGEFLRQSKLRGPKRDKDITRKAHLRNCEAPAGISDLYLNRTDSPTRNLQENPIVDLTVWKLSDYDGLYTYHDGKKRWFHCVFCKYHSDRLYHSKMHYLRIHINGGKAMEKKRKYLEVDADEQNETSPKTSSPVKAKKVQRGGAKGDRQRLVASPVNNLKRQRLSTARALPPAAPEPALQHERRSGRVAADTARSPWTADNTASFSGSGRQPRYGSIGSGIDARALDPHSPNSRRKRTDDPAPVAPSDLDIAAPDPPPVRRRGRPRRGAAGRAAALLRIVRRSPSIAGADAPRGAEDSACAAEAVGQVGEGPRLSPEAPPAAAAAANDDAEPSDRPVTPDRPEDWPGGQAAGVAGDPDGRAPAGLCASSAGGMFGCGTPSGWASPAVTPVTAMASRTIRPRSSTPADGGGVFLRPSVPSTPVDDFYARRSVTPAADASFLFAGGAGGLWSMRRRAPSASPALSASPAPSDGFAPQQNASPLILRRPAALAADLHRLAGGAGGGPAGGAGAWLGLECHEALEECLLELSTEEEAQLYTLSAC